MCMLLITPMMANLQASAPAGSSKLSADELVLAKKFLGKLDVSSGQVVTDPSRVFALDG